MILHLRGTAEKLGLGEVMVDVNGVGYKVSVPITVWELIEDHAPCTLWISSYIREDRFDLFGFPDRAGLTLFEEFLKLNGVGPKLGLELSAVPRSLLRQAAEENDPALLKNIKGIGRKTAEKLVLELRSLLERHPLLLGTSESNASVRHEFDQDAISALAALGYDAPTISEALRRLPPELHSTEERVAAALRSL